LIRNLKLIESEWRKSHPKLQWANYFVTGTLNDAGRARIRELSRLNQVEQTNILLFGPGYITPEAKKKEKEVYKDDECRICVYI